MTFFSAVLLISGKAFGDHQIWWTDLCFTWYWQIDKLQYKSVHSFSIILSFHSLCSLPCEHSKNLLEPPKFTSRSLDIQKHMSTARPNSLIYLPCSHWRGNSPGALGSQCQDLSTCHSPRSPSSSPAHHSGIRTRPDAWKYWPRRTRTRVGTSFLRNRSQLAGLERPLRLLRKRWWGQKAIGHMSIPWSKK